jgi:hypothetical protein
MMPNKHFFLLKIDERTPLINDVRSTSHQDKYNMKLYSHNDNPNLHYLQRWAGSSLDNIQWVSDFAALRGIKDSTIILEAEESNYQFDITQQLARSNNQLVFCSFFNSGAAGSFQELIDDLGMNPDMFLLCSSSYSQLPSVNLNEWRHRLADYPNQLIASAAFDDIYSLHKKPFQFNWINSRSRVQRRRLWRLMEDRDLLRQGLCSWSHDCEAAPDWDGTKEQPIDIVEIPPQYLSPLVRPAELDLRRRYNLPWKDFRLHWSEEYIISSRLRDSYFTVHVESDIIDPCLTYKVYNCLLAGHPFLVLGAPGYYQYLRDLGFRTFEPWIDESFAQGDDLDQRLEQMVNAVQKLCELNLDDWLQDVKPICEHNRLHFINSQWDHWWHTHLELDRFFRKLQNQN